MMKKNLSVLTLGLVLFLVIGVIKEARAEISIWEDKFTVTGFLRHEFGLHTAGSNPNNVNIGNHDVTLSRSFFHTEWNFKPSDTFRLFIKPRITSDQTYHIDDELTTYDAFPVDVPDTEWTMLQTSGDDFRAEVWELYSDIDIGNLWLRLGKQQIVWGEMIATRLMDVINPLDFSWNFLFEPEEFENIRIPNWAARGIYSLGQTVNWVTDLTIEGFFNPGDVLPNQYADSGAPFNIFPPNLGLPPFFTVGEQDQRGKIEYGFRLGGMIGDFYLTLNYLHVYSDDFQLQFQDLVYDPIMGVPLLAPLDFTPFSILVDKVYPEVDIYGLTFNYFTGGKLNTVVTFEGTCIPNQPYGDALNPLPDIRDRTTYSYAVRLNRLTFLLPRPTRAMDVMLQFNQTIRKGDEEELLGAGASEVDKSDETITFQLRQPLWYNNIEIQALFVYDLEDAYMFKPGFKYVYGDNWYFDLFGVALGGPEDRPGRFGSLEWADQIVARATFQF